MNTSEGRLCTGLLNLEVNSMTNYCKLWTSHFPFFAFRIINLCIRDEIFATSQNTSIQYLEEQ